MTEWTGIITMKQNRVSYYIKEGVSSIFTHGFMSFASVCIIIACLIIMGSFSLLSLNVSNIISTLEAENQILAFVDDNLTEEDARALQSKLEGISNIADVEFVTREDAMEDFTDRYDDDLFEGLGPEILRHRYVVYLDDIALMQQTQQDISEVQGIAKVNAHLEISQGFISMRNIVSAVSLLLVIILFVVSLFIMSNTIKLATFERREEIAIMKMVGATSAFIRWPFVVEGLILGSFGALTAFLMQWGIYKFIADKIVAAANLSFIDVISFSTVALPMIGAFLIVGLGVGVIGSLMAIRNYLKV